MIAWDVYLNGEQIDTVFYNANCNEEYVQKSLIDHDGYDFRIVVEKG